RPLVGPSCDRLEIITSRVLPGLDQWQLAARYDRENLETKADQISCCVEEIHAHVSLAFWVAPSSASSVMRLGSNTQATVPRRPITSSSFALSKWSTMCSRAPVVDASLSVAVRRMQMPRSALLPNWTEPDALAMRKGLILPVSS